MKKIILLIFIILLAIGSGYAYIVVNQKIQAGEITLANGQKKYNAGVIKFNDGKAALAAGKQQLAAGKIRYSTGKAQLADGKKKLNAGKAQLSSAETIYHGVNFIPGTEVVKNLPVGRMVFDTAGHKISAGKHQVAHGEQQVATGEQQLASGAKKIRDGEKKLADGEKQLAAGEKKLAVGKIQLEQGAQKLKQAKQLRTVLGHSTFFFIFLFVSLIITWRKSLLAYPAS